MEIIPKENKCFCKGIRTCAICEDLKLNKNKKNIIESKEINLDNLIEKNEEDINNESLNMKIKSYYINTNKLKSYLNELKYEIIIENIIKEEIERIKEEIDINNNKIEEIENIENIFDGIYIIENIYNDENKQEKLIKEINNNKWNNSQSGRMKQDYGPKINYKKRKVKKEEKNELIPEYINELIINDLQKINNKLLNLSDFKVKGVGNLLYYSSQGAHIDPHIDDYWIWGNRIIGINLLSDSIITFSYQINSYAFKLKLYCEALKARSEEF